MIESHSAPWREYRTYHYLKQLYIAFLSYFENMLAFWREQNGRERASSQVSLEQQRLRRWLASDAFELRIMLPERLGDFHFCAAEQTDQLQRVHDSLPLKMIVGDDEGGVTAFGQMPDARGN